jgi:hypothetical protein
MSRHTRGGGEGVREMSPGGGGSKKCGKSVAYYLNDPFTVELFLKVSFKWLI